MKKILYIFYALCAISCTQSNEDKITSAFKEYVCNNFDDPSSLDEIVSIEVTDTVSKRGLIDIIDEYDNLVEISSSVSKSLIDSLNNMAFVNGDIYGTPTKAAKRVAHKIEYKAMVDKMDDYVDRLIELASKTDPDYYYEKMCDAKDTMVINYVLKYRTKTNGTKKINSIYVRTDSLLNKIEFNDKDKPFGISGIDGLSDNATILLDYYNKRLEYAEEYQTVLRKMINLITSSDY